MEDDKINLDKCIAEVHGYSNYVKDHAYKFKSIDTHALKLFYRDPNIPFASKETKVTLWILGIFVIIFAIICHVGMIPIRLAADIRFLFEDLIKNLEKKDK